MKEIFEKRPCFPRYKQICDVKQVLQYLRTLSPAHRWDLKQLPKKLLILIAVLSAQRAQSLHLLDIEHMNLTSTICSFKIAHVVKQSKPGRHIKDLVFRSYAPDRRFCVVTYIHRYLAVTSALRGEYKHFFISYNKPHKSVSKETLRRWLTQVMRDSGIGVTVFKRHSIRLAATSATRDRATSITSIIFWRLLAGAMRKRSPLTITVNLSLRTDSFLRIYLIMCKLRTLDTG